LINNGQKGENEDHGKNKAGAEAGMNDNGSALQSTKETLFRELLESRDTVFRICLGFCRNSRDAEDLTHDVYVTAYMKINALKNIQSRKSWLYKIARNTCLNHLRRSPHQSLLSLDACAPAVEGATPEESLELQEQLEILKTVISTLPRRMKEVFVLREYGRLAYEEIAGALGLRLGTVMSRLNRARQSVTRKMRSHNYG